MTKVYKVYHRSVELFDYTRKWNAPANEVCCALLEAAALIMAGLVKRDECQHEVARGLLDEIGANLSRFFDDVVDSEIEFDGPPQ